MMDCGIIAPSAAAPLSSTVRNDIGHAPKSGAAIRRLGHRTRDGGVLRPHRVADDRLGAGRLRLPHLRQHRRHT